MRTATVQIGTKQWGVEVAVTSAELTQGLGGRASLLPYSGMLFDLGSERIVTVNAHEMLFPLSVIFIGLMALPGGPGAPSVLAVTEFSLLLAPGDEGTSSLPCRYFLEVNVGEIDDVNTGDLVTITGYTPSAGINISELMSLMVTMMMVTMMMKMMMETMKEVK